MTAVGAAFTVFLTGIGAWLLLRWVGDALSPPSSTGPQRLPFTGGLAPEVHAWSRYHTRYYAMALLFLAFDMEMVFMYPWAVVFVQEGVKALVEMLMFIVILTLGILYAWRERALEWA
ncbi:MAG: NADH-quinone oxidoreductase subunit A [Gemmatimonadales bacterium]